MTDATTYYSQRRILHLPKTGPNRWQGSGAKGSGKDTVLYTHTTGKQTGFFAFPSLFDVCRIWMRPSKKPQKPGLNWAEAPLIRRTRRIACKSSVHFWTSAKEEIIDWLIPRVWQYPFKATIEWD